MSFMTIIIAATTPLPFDNTNRIYAAGQRAWQLTCYLLSRGLEVVLVGIEPLANQPLTAYSGKMEAGYYPELAHWLDKLPAGKLSYFTHYAHEFTVSDLFKQICEETSATCIIGVGNYASHLVARANPIIPFWADLFGHYMSEAQAKAFVYNDNSYLPAFLNQELLILKNAAHFSTVSTAQKYALIGELGLVGRLMAGNYGEDFITVVPAAFTPKPQTIIAEKKVRGILCDKYAYALLWSGGFNTWSDPETLFQGVDAAMARVPNLHFIVTGGEIVGHDEESFRIFQNKVLASNFKERYHLVGWVSGESLPSYYTECNAAIVLDRYCYEGVLGSRTRILDWIGYSLAAISTPTSELVKELADQGGIFTVESQKPAQLEELLVNLATNNTFNHPQEVTEKALDFANQHYAVELVFQPIVDWCLNPVPQLHPPVYNFAENSGASHDVTETEEWAHKLQSELLAKEWQIGQLKRELQSQYREYEELRDWALSLEQQLLLHTRKK